MQITTGCDIVQISRFSHSIRQEKVLDNLFVASERQNKEIEHLAGIFAAKEAIVKALGLKPGNWLKYEVASRADGKPEINVLDPVISEKIKSLDLSISHDGDYAMAVVVAVR